jgi:uncharacterized protein
MVTTNGALITHDMIPSLNEIQLKHYQITLDGGKEFHNKTRFSTNLKDSFGKIVDNVTMLVSAINDIDMTIRINCTSENIHSIHEISECFSTTLRPNIIRKTKCSISQNETYIFPKRNVPSEHFLE